MLIDRPVGRARCSDGPAPGGGGVGRGAYPWSAILYITPSLRHSTISPPGELCHLVFKFCLRPATAGSCILIWLSSGLGRVWSLGILGLRPATTGSCILGLRTSGHGRVWYRSVAPRSALAGTCRGSFPSYLLLTCPFRAISCGWLCWGKPLHAGVKTDMVPPSHSLHKIVGW